MSKGRLEAFSDAVIAIVMTIMVLELRPPEGATLGDLATVAPVGLSYLLSFTLLGIYWNNHHHLFQAAKTVDGRVLWANLHLLFWLSLFPFATAWLGHHPTDSIPVATYGVVLLLAGLAYFLLVKALIRAPGQTPALAVAVGRDTKGQISLVTYLLALPLAFLVPALSIALFVVVEVMWFIPDRRMERAVRG